MNPAVLIASIYVFALAARHTDGRVIRQTLPGALEWLWQGYPPGP